MDTPAGGNTGRESMIIPSPLNLPGRSASEVSESNVGVDPIVQNDRDYSSDLNEAINTPLGKPSSFSSFRHADGFVRNVY